MDGPFSEGLLPSHKKHDDAEFDITAMIDLVFLMNIYFMFLFITVSDGELTDMPSAVHAASIESDEAMTITIMASSDPNFVLVRLAGQKEDIRDPAMQEQMINAAADAAVREKKTKILIKAQKSVRLREIQRIVAAASRDEFTLHVAVTEAEEKAH